MKSGITTAASMCLTAVLLAGTAATAGELPKSTQMMVKALKLEGKPFLKGMDEEAGDAPADLVAAAKKEGTLTISGSIDADEFRKMSAPLLERYPFLKITYNSADTFARNIKPLIAFKEGRILADIVEGLGVNLSQYMKAKALMKIDDIPNWKNVPGNMKDKEGYYVGPRVRYWCMTYNKNKVKESELPATWDDLLTIKSLRNGRIGMGNRPNNFMIMLWGAKGEAWSRDFLDKLFGVVKPQLRKEGADGLVGLTAAGELDIAFPTAAYRTAQYIAKGAPVGWHCPAPVPISSSAMVIINGSTHAHAAKLYINWFLSKEGQIAQHYADGSPPVHRDLQNESFLAFPKEIVGRPGAVRTPQLLEHDMAKVAKLWEDHWLGAQGLKMQTVEATIAKVAARGAAVSFKTGSETHTVSISGSRTKIQIAGKKAKRNAIKAGMKCSVTYPGNKQEAKAINCK